MSTSQFEELTNDLEGSFLCEAYLCKPDPADADVLVGINHECSRYKRVREDMLLCSTHLDLVQRDMVRCRWCGGKVSLKWVRPL